MAKAVTLKNSNDEEVYPVTDISLVNGELPTTRIADDAITTDKVADGAVTSDKIDWTTLYVKATDLSGDKSFNSGYTEIQTITLPAGKWLIFWGIRAYFSTNATDMVSTGVSHNGNAVQTVITNYVVYQATARFMQTGVYEATTTGTESYMSFINAPGNGSVSAAPSYLFALRVG